MDEKSTVVAFRIPLINDPKCTNVRNFQIKEFDELKLRVVKAKKLYDKPNKYDPKRFYYIIRQFEHANVFRREIHAKYSTPNISNAWLKAYELFIHYKVFPTKPTNKFVYFDNAAFPGSFILAAWHIVHTLCDIKKFEWYGSSLLSSDEIKKLKRDKGPLDDKYKMYENYPSNWLMNEHNNGDVTSVDNQLEFKNRMGGSVDLYTSDLGFDVSQDYNKQEELHAHANMGQIITALLVLRKGGIMITKQYSYFEPFTVSLIGLLTIVFDKVEISKPMFSKSGNSETYIIGLGYKASGDIDGKSVVSIMLDRLKNWSLKPLTTKKCLGNTFLSVIIQSQKYFADTQIVKLTDIISEYNRFVKEKKTDRSHIADTNKFKEDNTRDLEKWIMLNPMKRLRADKKLNVKEALARGSYEEKSNNKSKKKV